MTYMVELTKTMLRLLSKHSFAERIWVVNVTSKSERAEREQCKNNEKHHVI